MVYRKKWVFPMVYRKKWGFSHGIPVSKCGVFPMVYLGFKMIFGICQVARLKSDWVGSEGSRFGDDPAAVGKQWETRAWRGRDWWPNHQPFLSALWWRCASGNMTKQWMQQESESPSLNMADAVTVLFDNRPRSSKQSQIVLLWSILKFVYMTLLIITTP